MIHNAHVLKWYRWRIWVAAQTGRQMAQTFLIQWYQDELAKLSDER